MDPGAFVIVTVCRLDHNARHKGVERVLEAVEALRAEGFPVSYVIVGGGQDAARIDRHIARLRLERTAVRVGNVSDADMKQILWASDAFALPSVPEGPPHNLRSVEGFGIALLEANCAGLPVIATAIAGAADAMKAGVSGLKVDGSPRAIADAIKRLSRDGGGLEPGAPARWAKGFAWEPRRAAVVEAFTADRSSADGRGRP
jgi:glycosyltransferase involved in cell wall biosynthesis